MKTYISVILGVALLAVVVFTGYKINQNSKHKTNNQVSYLLKTVPFSYDVKRFPEAEKNISYNFNLPADAIATTTFDGALVRISDESTPFYSSVYFSYEGDRGYTPDDYLSEIIAPHVSVIDPSGEVVSGDYTWEVTSSAGTNWYIAKAKDGKWLIVVEGRKTHQKEVDDIISSVKVK